MGVATLRMATIATDVLRPPQLVHVERLSVSRLEDEAAHSRTDLYDRVTRQLVDALYRQQEAVLNDFLTSGAMPRDLRVECGLSYVEQDYESGRSEVKLVARQNWRIV